MRNVNAMGQHDKDYFATNSTPVRAEKVSSTQNTGTRSLSTIRYMDSQCQLVQCESVSIHYARIKYSPNFPQKVASAIFPYINVTLSK